MFRRRRGRHRNESVDDARVDGFEEIAADLASTPTDRPDGPWDVAEAAPDIDRVDLGALRVPKGPDLVVQADLADDQIVAATVVHGGSALQVQALAAPKTAGIWDETRFDVARELREKGGSAAEVDGTFGTELRAGVPAPAPGGNTVTRPARFVGVDGPRWLLRGVFTGPAAENHDAAKRLEEVFRAIVVVRGDAPVPPGDLLELQFPPEMQAPEGDGGDNGQPEPDPLRRGPEITETR